MECWFYLGDDHLSSKQTVYVQRNKHQQVFRTSTHFFTDRAIYRPGQTVYFKGIVIKTDGEHPEIVTNHTEAVQFLDANRQKIAELKLTTNEYGTLQRYFWHPDRFKKRTVSYKNYKRTNYRTGGRIQTPEIWSGNLALCRKLSTNANRLR